MDTFIKIRIIIQYIEMWYIENIIFYFISHRGILGIHVHSHI